MTPTAGRWTWLDAARWDAIAEESPAATGFHRRAWSEAVARNDPRFRARALGFEFESGAQALLPLVVRRGALRRGPFARAVSTQPGTYGGPILAGGGLDEEQWTELLAALPRAPFGRLDCFGNVQAPLPAEVAARAAVASEERETHVLELAELPEDAAASYRSSCRRALRKAARAEVRCRRLGPADVSTYHDVYRETLARWGKAEERGYPRALFEDLVGCDGVELWAAETVDGVMAACGTFLFSRSHCVYWHGAMRAEQGELRPMNLLMHTLIEESRARGCARFDFNPSGELAGVRAFKESFAARAVSFLTWRHTAAPFARRGR